MLKGHAAAVRSARFSAAGTQVVTASDDRTARIRRTTDGTLLHELRGDTAHVRFAAFGPNDQVVVTISTDRTARVWSVEDGALVATLEGHTRPVVDAAFSPDGRHLFLAFRDRLSRALRQAFEARGENLSADVAPGGETGRAPTTSPAPGRSPAPRGVAEAARRSSWARMLRKVYEAEPLICARCRQEMVIVAWITDPEVVDPSPEAPARAGTRLALRVPGPVASSREAFTEAVCPNPARAHHSAADGKTRSPSMFFSKPLRALLDGEPKPDNALHQRHTGSEDGSVPYPSSDSGV